MRAKPIVDPEGERRTFASKRRPLKVPADFTWAAMGGVPVLTHGSGDRTLFYVHGGSYNGNAAAQHFSLVRRLAARCNLRVIFPDYPLAPDFPWTSSHPQMSALLSGLAAEGPVVLAGDSAGGGYALSLAMSLATPLDGAGSHPLESMVLISPWLDVSCSAPGIEEAAEWDPWLRLDRARVYGQWWAGDPTHTSRWEVSPLHGSLANLPRTLAFQGTRDILCPETDSCVTRQHVRAGITRTSRNPASCTSTRSYPSPKQSVPSSRWWSSLVPQTTAQATLDA
ncbi:MAG: alpha/beta hydrolase [Marmoricola sp.]